MSESNLTVNYDSIRVDANELRSVRSRSYEK